MQVIQRPHNEKHNEAENGEEPDILPMQNPKLIATITALSQRQHNEPSRAAAAFAAPILEQSAWETRHGRHTD